MLKPPLERSNMKFWIACIFSFFLSGCSTSSVFRPYPSQMAPNLNDAARGQYAAAIKTLQKDQKSNDYALYAAELGRFQQLSGDYTGSSATFMPLMSLVEAQALGPKVQASQVLADTGSLLSNDNAIPYRLRPYEIILLYQSEALNYIAQGEISNALVSLRKANLAQATLQQNNQLAQAKTQENLQKNQLNTRFLDDPNSPLAATLQAEGNIKSTYLNAMTYYLFALLSLNAGNTNDAAVALKQAVSISPDNTYLQTALLQTLQAQGASSSIIQNYLKAFHRHTVPSANPKNATLVIWYDNALVPPKSEVDIPLPLIGLGQIQNFSFPVYQLPPSLPPTLSVSIEKSPVPTPLPPTELITSVYGLAAKQLESEYPAIFLRAGLRLMTKAAATDALSTQDNPLLGLAMQVYSILSSQADLRSWLSLPKNTQIAQYSLPPQAYTLLFQNNDQKTEVNITLQTGQMSLIWITEIGGNLEARVLQ